ncbi:MAG: hypothetical protein IH600_15140 [Bacteroidetes bacterium]|nr:hypothetical protein [Bacteroidota bacterium]
MENQDLIIAGELRRKYFFFMLGLTLAILGVTITTFKPYALMVLNYIEISCWLLLVIAGFAIIMCIRHTIAYHTSVGILTSDSYDWTSRKLAKQGKPRSVKYAHVFSIVFYTSFALAFSGLMFNRLLVAIMSLH